MGITSSDFKKPQLPPPPRFIKVEELKPRQWRVKFYNGVNMGEIERDVNGYFKFWPAEHRGGYIDESVFEAFNEIHVLLKALNAPYEREIRAYFEAQYNKTIERLKADESR